MTKVDLAPFRPVPAEVTKVQLRRALLQMPGTVATAWDDLKAFIATRPADSQEEWDLVNDIPRDHPEVASGATLMSWDADQVDEIFRLAATL